MLNQDEVEDQPKVGSDDALRTRIVTLETKNARLQEQLAVAKRLLNFTTDQLELLVDPEKLAYVEWNLSSTYTLQLMCETYREGKMEVRRYKALAERRKVDILKSGEDCRYCGRWHHFSCRHITWISRLERCPGHTCSKRCKEARAAIEEGR